MLHENTCTMASLLLSFSLSPSLLFFTLSLTSLPLSHPPTLLLPSLPPFSHPYLSEDWVGLLLGLLASQILLEILLPTAIITAINSGL